MTDTDHPRFDADSPRDWCGCDRRASNGDSIWPHDCATLNGVDLEAWRSSMLPPESLPVETRDTDRAPPESRWSTLIEIGLAEALDAIEAVAAGNQDKHPGREWETQTIGHQDAKCIKHLGSAQAGEPIDADSGLPARAHAACRLIMALGLELKQNP